MPWLKEDDIPASPLEHVIPMDHKMSVIEVNNECNRIDRVATAILAGRREFTALEFIVFDERIVNEVGIEIDKTAVGETYDFEVNSWHRDFINVSANKLVALAKRTLPITTIDFVLEKRMKDVFKETVRSKKVNWSAVQLKEKKNCKEKLLKTKIKTWYQLFVTAVSLRP